MPSRLVLMGDPALFFIKKGANPHTRNWLGIRKKVDPRKAFLQWHAMARTLMRFGVQIYVIPVHPDHPGLVFPANAGFVPEADQPRPLASREFVLSNLGPARSEEKEIYRSFVSGLGLKVHEINAQFEGEADLIPWRANLAWKDRFIFTYGKLKKQRFVPCFGIPPWKRVYGFRSDERAAAELSRWVPSDRLLCIELTDERYYHGDTVFCSFGPTRPGGPNREYLLAYRGGITPDAARKIGKEADVIWISNDDAREFAANSFQVIHQGRCVLFMPHGATPELREQIEKRGVETVPIDVSEFFLKGGGSVKCLVGDLGAYAEEKNISKEMVEFRKHHEYSRYFSSSQ